MYILNGKHLRQSVSPSRIGQIFPTTGRLPYGLEKSKTLLGLFRSGVTVFGDDHVCH